MGKAHFEIIHGDNGHAFVRFAPDSHGQSLLTLIQYGQQLPTYGGHRILLIDAALGTDMPDINGFDKVIFWGKVGQGASKGSIVWSSPDQAREFLPDYPVAKSLILIYARDEATYAELYSYLGAPLHQGQLKVDLGALRHNIEVHRSVLEPSTGVAVMVKANAYGAGLVGVGRALEQAGVTYLTVAYADEGVALRKAGVQCPIMVLNTEINALEHFVSFQLEPVIYQFDLLIQLTEGLERHDGALSVHLEFNTGMNRLGFEPDEAGKIGHYLEGRTAVRAATAFAHLAASGEPQHDTFTLEQKELLLKACHDLEEKLGYKVQRHLLNSGGVARFPQYGMDMVRLGIAVYGDDETEVLQPDLQTVMTFEAKVSQVRILGADQTIGYGRHGRLPAGSKVATLGIGYADGVRRTLSNGNFAVNIKGQRSPIVGNVCMDMCMVDVSNVPGVQEGDVVTFFGDHLSVREMADVLNTIPYEVFTSVGPRVRRVYLDTFEFKPKQ